MANPHITDDNKKQIILVPVFTTLLGNGWRHGGLGCKQSSTDCEMHCYRTFLFFPVELNEALNFPKMTA
jgi:hypothetical protein